MYLCNIYSLFIHFKSFFSMKRILLSFLTLVAAVASYAQGKDDFSTLTASSSYAADLTTEAGWKIANAAVQEHGDVDSNPKFAIIPADTKAVCINGKTTAIGTITSPVVSGGIGTLKFSYAYVFSETKGVSLKVEVKQGGVTVASQDVVNAGLTKNTPAEASLDFGIKGDVQIVITNNSPSASTKNADRTSVWGIEWTAGPTEGEVFVAAPMASLASGIYYGDQTLTLTSAPETSIVYTINDGAETDYTEPLALTAPGVYSVKAYAKDAAGVKSELKTVDLDLRKVETYTTSAELRTACTVSGEADAPTVDFAFTDLLVTGVQGSNTYVADASGAYLLYGTNALGLKKGDKISGKVQGKLYMYYGLGELSVKDSYANVTKSSSDNAVEPNVAAITDVIDSYATYEASYVRLEKVTFSKATINYTYGDPDYRTVTLTDEAGNEINFYDGGNVFKTFTFDTAKQYNVNCFVVKRDPSVQLNIIDVNDVQIITDLKTPTSAWSVASDEISEGATSTASFTSDSDGAVTFTSSDEAVAKVSAEGVITGVGAGTCTITATTAETAVYLGSTATVSVTVKPVVGGIETFTNGGFEEWLTDAQPKNWKSVTTASNATLSKSADAHSGEASVLIAHTASSNKRMAYREMLLPAGWYTMQLYAKSASDVLAVTRLGYAPLDVATGKLGSYSYGSYTSQLSNTEWTLVTYTFELTAETQVNLVVMNPQDYKDKATGTVTAYGDLLVDDVEFRAATADEINATGIKGIVQTDGEDVRYNTAGQKVGDDYRGIVIVNGKKYLKK